MKERLLLLAGGLALATSMVLAAAWAVPALAGGSPAPPPRTGEIYDDHSNFTWRSFNIHLGANCRLSDDNAAYNSNSTFTLGAVISYSSNSLIWVESGGNLLSSRCEDFRIAHTSGSSVKLKCECLQKLPGTGATAFITKELTLSDKIAVNSQALMYWI